MTEITPVIHPYDVLKNICNNKGILHVNGTCTCASGFEGKNCEISVCDGYCVTGTCTVGENGQQTCKCPETNYGDRCEKQLCLSKCQNGGDCILDSAGNSRCECAADYVGDLCQFKLTWLNQLCSVYCMHTLSKSQQSLPVCR